MRSTSNRQAEVTPKPEAPKEAMGAVTLDKYERCNFCSSRLIFTHDLNLSYLEVVETSRCPGCGVTSSPRKHTLQ